MAERPRLLSVAESVERAGVSATTLTKWISEGLPTIAHGRSKLIREDHLVARLNRYYKELAASKAAPRGARPKRLADGG